MMPHQKNSQIQLNLQRNVNGTSYIVKSSPRNQATLPHVPLHNTAKEPQLEHLPSLPNLPTLHALFPEPPR